MSFSFSKIKDLEVQSINGTPYSPGGGGILVNQATNPGHYYITLTQVVNTIATALKQTVKLLFDPINSILFVRSIQWPGFGNPDSSLDIFQGSLSPQSLKIYNTSSGDIELSCNGPFKITAGTPGALGQILTNTAITPGQCTWQDPPVLLSQSIAPDLQFVPYALNSSGVTTSMSTNLALRYKASEENLYNRRFISTYFPFEITLPTATLGAGVIVSGVIHINVVSACFYTLDTGANISSFITQLGLGNSFTCFVCNPNGNPVTIIGNTGNTLIGGLKNTSFTMVMVADGMGNWRTFI